jgi:hypothetical protein
MMRVEADIPFLEDLDGDLVRAVTGLEPNARGEVLFPDASVRSTQRLAIGGRGGGVAVFTWPGELKPQAEYLYRDGRGRRLLAAAASAGWEAEPRPHLAFWRSKPTERLYLDATISAEEYVDQLSRGDLGRVGEYRRDAVAGELWPWLVERGYASEADAARLPEFLERLRRRNDRPAHFRPGLRLVRRWPSDEVRRLSTRGELAGEIRTAVNAVLGAVGDSTLPLPAPA